MSNSFLGYARTRFEQTSAKNLTPKSAKYSPKASPLFGSVRLGPKVEISRGKITKPMTAKNVNDSMQYFRSREQERKQFYNSTRKLDLTQKVRPILEYQPRSKSKSPIRHQDEIVREEVFITPKTFAIQNRGVRNYENKHPLLPKTLMPISNFQQAKYSNKSNGIIRAFAASTNQGPVREYNEDRVAIILTIARPKNCTDWKKAAYFGVFDGHGGMDCADFLRDNLHLFISKQKNFPHNLDESIRGGFDKCQKAFLEQSYNGKLDKSGSCATIAFFYDDECFVSNVGDSRAIMSTRGGKFIQELSLDHKASDEYEQKRIIQNYGKIYQTKLRNANPAIKILYEGEEHDFVLGPHRAFPGRLSVTRTFGDIQAKIPQFGGNQKAIICTPEIESVKINEESDFILLACDGIYDKLSNEEVIDIVWDTFRRDKGHFTTLHEFCGRAVQNIMKLSFNKKTLDNVTVVLIALEGLQNHFNALEKQKIELLDKKVKVSKLENSFQNRQFARSISPSNYSSLRKSFYARH